MNTTSIKDHLKTFGEFVSFLEKYENNPDENLPDWVNDLDLDQKSPQPYIAVFEDIINLGFKIGLSKYQAFNLTERIMVVVHKRHRYKDHDSFRQSAERYK